MNLKQIASNALHNKFILYLLLLITAFNLLVNNIVAICVLVLFALVSSLFTTNNTIILSVALISMWLYNFDSRKIEAMGNATDDISSYKDLLQIQKEIMSNISSLEQSLENAEKFVAKLTKSTDS